MSSKARLNSASAPELSPSLKSLRPRSNRSRASCRVTSVAAVGCASTVEGTIPQSSVVERVSATARRRLVIGGDYDWLLSAVEGQPQARHQTVGLEGARPDGVVLEAGPDADVASAPPHDPDGPLVEDAGRAKGRRPLRLGEVGGLGDEVPRSDPELGEDAEPLPARPEADQRG